MSTMDAKSKPTLGFLTVVEHPQYGLFGGYLVLNTAGRPLEFHCTAPIKPNRAQEILYGPTLESFLYGEQIGQTLINQGGVTAPVGLHRPGAGAGRPRVRIDAAGAGASARGRDRPGATARPAEPVGPVLRLDAPITAARGWRPSSSAATAWPCPSRPRKTAG